MHGSLFYSLFERDPSEVKVLASGFAKVNGEWRFNSFTLNTGFEGWQDDKKGMHEVEIRLLKEAIKLWQLPGAKQTISVKEC